jgi:guanosine-3',5'-bis(diphosphate) 3'-pyrophosphohydrolase
MRTYCTMWWKIPMLRLEDIELEFGKKVAKIIDGLTKISGVFDTNSSLQAENFP